MFKITIDRIATEIINRLKQTMSRDYMRAGESAEPEPDPFDDTPFTRVEEVKLSSDEWIDVILSEAEKIRSTAKNRGTISTDKAVVDALAVPRESIDRATFLAYKVGPVAATCEDLNWKSAYTMDLEAAPEPNSDEFREAASELNMPNSVSLKLGPDFIEAAYRTLFEHTADTGRPMHPIRLRREAKVRLPERGYRRAFSFMDKLPGVESPADSVAWEYDQPEAIEAKEQTHV